MRRTTILLLLLFALPVLAAPADHVIFISVDGLRADLLSDLLASDVSGDYANYQRLIDEGSATFNARTDYSHTVTLPNHTCMMTGRPTLQPAGQPTTVHHGYTSNSTPGPLDTLHNTGNTAVPYIASVFDVAHDHGLSTGLFASKSKFILFDRSYDATYGAPDFTGPDDGADKIDVYHEASSGSPSNAAPMHAVFMAQLAVAPPHYSFVHYRDPDSAGHASGWGSTSWNNAVQATDGYLGDILDFIDANPGLMGRTVVIVTADHGGYGTNHSVATDARDFTIPFFAWGTDVPAGGDLYALNAGHRLDPGTNRPDYNAAVAPIRNGDSGNLALSLLGLPAIPGSTVNAAQDLVVTLRASAVPETSGPVLAALQASPNPFNPTTVLRFHVPDNARNVSLDVFDARGRLVKALHQGGVGSGWREATWDGRNARGARQPSGVYFAKLSVDGRAQIQKLALVK